MTPFFVFCLWVLLSMWSGKEQLLATPNAMQVSSGVSLQELGPYLQIFEDSERTLSIAEVVQLPPEAWRASHVRIPTFGFTKSRYWLRFRLENGGEAAILRWLEAEYSHYDTITFYELRGDEIKISKMGDHQAFAERPIAYKNFVLPLELGAKASLDIYVACETSGPLFFPLNLWEPEAFAAQKSKQDHWAGYYYGLLLGMFVYNLFLFVTLARSSYLYYALYILGFFFFQMSLHGFAYAFLWSEASWWANNCVAFFLAFSLFWMTLFTRDFIETPRMTPRLHYGVLAILVACVGVAVLSLLGRYSIAIRLGTVLSLISAAFFLLCGLLSLSRGFSPARYYVLAFAAFLGGIIVNASKQLGFLDQSFFSEYAIQIGSALEVVLLSLALGHKIRVEQKAAHTSIAKLNQDLELKIGEVRQLNIELIEKERARTAFFHNTSHELRTPLNGILGYVQLLTMGRFGALSSESLQPVQKIKSLAHSLLMQVNMILDLAKSRKGQLELKTSRFRLSELIHNLDALAQGLKQRYPRSSFTLETKGFEESHEFASDLEKILTVCRNLLGNAFKFARPQQPNHVFMGLQLNSEGLTIKIEDQGIGIPEDKKNRVFEEFFQVEGDARRNYEGTGLGLAIVKQYLDLLSGKIELESRLGVGTKMTVELPDLSHQEVGEAPPARQNIQEVYTVPADPKTASKEAEERPLPNHHPAKILLIDDNATNCDVITEILRMQGYQAESAQSGKEGLALIKQAKPDLLLLDLMMPEMSGEDVLRELKAASQTKDLPVILLTARASEEDRILGLSLGADDYLAKPIIPDELYLRVRNIVERLRLAKSAVEKQMIETALAQLQQFNASFYRDIDRRQELSILHYYQSAEVAGGDWYGISFDEKRKELYVLLGDVTGHGTSSALLTLTVAGSVRGWLAALAQSQEELDQTTVLLRLGHSLNELLYYLGGTLEKSMTMCFVAINMETGRGTYINAGHHPIYRIHDEKVEVMLRSGNPLGFEMEPNFGMMTFELAKDEMLFLYTDGLVENRGHEGEHISTRDLMRILKITRNPEQLHTLLVDKAQVLWKDKELDDDVAFLIIRRQAVDAGSIQAAGA